MKRTHFALGSALLGCAALLVQGGAAEAQVFRARSYRPAYNYGPVSRPTNPDHMPGWDWRQTYPWSPYNYGRNPYNPAWVPSPYPVPGYAPVSPYSAVPPGSSATYTVQQPQMPQPTGGPPVVPPDAALIEVRVPEPFASVLFDDHRTFTQGNTLRYFVTPELPVGQTSRYTVTASWTRNGQPVTEQRQVQVARGQMVQVDFTRPAGR